VLLTASRCPAQQAQPAGVQGQTPVFTLKVYTNLVQVPALVLDGDLQPLPRIDFRRFLLSVDGGSQFAPTHVRLEGDDPIDIAILLDLTGEQRHLITSFEQAAATMVANSLGPQDRISIYVLNCHLIRSTTGSAPTPDLLRSAVEAAFAAPDLNKSDTPNTPCGKKVHLWNALASVVNDLGDSRSRRVVLAVTDGRDDGSPITWEDLREFAVLKGVALFGMSNYENNSIDPWVRDHVDPLASLCEVTGGIVLHVQNSGLRKKLAQWIALLRGRYVVEFPRPQQLPNGENSLVISIKNDPLAFVTFAGVATPLPDPKITLDPHYMPSQEGSDIPVGKRRSLSH
jgi:hypothetical protein